MVNIPQGRITIKELEEKAAKRRNELNTTADNLAKLLVENLQRNDPEEEAAFEKREQEPGRAHNPQS